MTHRTLLLLALSMAASGCSAVPPDDAGRTAHVTPLYQTLEARSEHAPIVVAHRGASSTCPENTVPAFRAATELGVGMIELDARQSSDGTLVCLHDETVDRTTDGPKLFGRDRVALRSLSLEQIRRLDAGSWKGPAFQGTALPTLGEALDTVLAGAVPMIEHKDGEPERYVKLLRDRGVIDDVVLQSFDWDWLAAVRRLAPQMTLGALGEGELTAERLTELDALGVSIVHWKDTDLTVDDLAALHARGFLVCIYTVDSDLELIGAARAGVDAITTNLPARLLELEQRGLARR